MYKRTLCSIWIVCAAVGAELIAARPAFAEQITRIEGGYDGIRPISGFQAAIFTFTDNAPGCQDDPPTATDCFGTAVLSPSTLAGFLARDLRIVLGSVGPGGTVGVDLDELTIFHPTLGQARFALTNGQLTTDPLIPFSGTITATATLVSGSSTFDPDQVDLSLFTVEGQGIFTATYQGILVEFVTINDSPDFIGEGVVGPAGDRVVGRATWNNNPGSPLPVSAQYVISAAVVPEPSSLALCGCGLMAFGGAAWLRRRLSP